MCSTIYYSSDDNDDGGCIVDLTDNLNLGHVEKPTNLFERTIQSRSFAVFDTNLLLLQKKISLTLSVFSLFSCCVLYQTRFKNENLVL